MRPPTSTARPEPSEKKAAPPAPPPSRHIALSPLHPPSPRSQAQTVKNPAPRALHLVDPHGCASDGQLHCSARQTGRPGFREANTAGRLAYTFAKLAAQGVDLSAVTVLAPQLTEVPTVELQHQMLHVKGYFPGQPLQIEFEMLYQPVAGRWRLFGLAVSAVPPAPAAAGAACPPANDRPAPAKQAK